MDEEELEPRRKAPKLRDLAPLAIAELETYITELEAEILRVKDDIAAKRKQRGGDEGKPEDEANLFAFVIEERADGKRGEDESQGLREGDGSILAGREMEAIG